METGFRTIMARTTTPGEHGGGSARRRCGCGSGRRYGQCCGATVELDGGRTATVTAVVGDAARRIEQGDTGAAATAIDAALAVVPKHPQALFLKGYLALVRDDPGGAVTHMERAIRHGLRDAAAHLHLATAFGRLQRRQDAEQALLRAVALKKDFRDAWHRLMQLRRESGNAVAAYEAARRANALAPLSVAEWEDLASALHRIGADRHAIDALRRAVATWPESPLLHASLAGILASSHYADEAREAVDEALRLDPDHPLALLISARLLRRGGELAEAGARLARLTPEHMTDTAMRAQVHWEQVKLNEQLERPDAAFEAAEKMNAAVREGQTLKGTFDEVEQRLAGIESRLPARAPDVDGDATPGTDGGAKAPRPLFILGFPRTGTTVLEMLLAQHPAIAAAGESRAIPEAEAMLAAHRLSPQECFSGEPSAREARAIASVRKAARARLQADSGATADAHVIVDKYPLNAMHMATIALLFPGATVIRMVRHPLDTAISCYLQLFGNDDAWHTSLHETCRFLARIDQHLERIHDRLPLDWINLRLEDMISAPEETVNGIFEAQGLAEMTTPLRLEGDASYHTRTASHEQVRGAVSDAHLQRRREYRRFVDDECRSLLADMCARWDYTP